MLVVTGAAGFIGSCLVSDLIQLGLKDIVVVDEFGNIDKDKNLEGKDIREFVERAGFREWLNEYHHNVDFVFHLGARTNTAEFDIELLNHLNLQFSKDVWEACANYSIPLIYASSAATYGLGEQGYADDEELLHLLKPLNPYGVSKNEFDKWAVGTEFKPPFWIGLKFFNVYGPNEYHKGRMASVILHAYRQIEKTGQMKLFRSHNPEFKDGEQMRDFIYVDDINEIILHFFQSRGPSGIYNAGTGKARTFLDLALATFEALGLEPKIEFIDTPEDIRDKYQYFTEANTQKLRAAGFDKRFVELEDGIQDYVQNYLTKSKYK